MLGRGGPCADDRRPAAREARGARAEGCAAQGYDVGAVAANLGDEEVDPARRRGAPRALRAPRRAREQRGRRHRPPVAEISTKQARHPARHEPALDPSSTASAPTCSAPPAPSTHNALVVNTASIAGKQGEAWLSVYSATKAGVVGFTQAMNRELKAQGIKSTALCPAFVDTAMTDFIKDRLAPEDMIQVADVVEAVRFLLRLTRVRGPRDRVHAVAAGAERCRRHEAGVTSDTGASASNGPRSARDRPGGRAARLRLGVDRGGLRLGRGDGPRLDRRADDDDRHRLGDLPDARAHPPR